MRLAIETGRPIIPITIGDNWFTFPDDGSYTARFSRLRVTIHKPIETYGMELSQLEELKNRCFSVIFDGLKEMNPQAVDSRTAKEQKI
jgi:1-acyl-sn-glycerol-3-phosphate acyltransferase